MIAQRGGLGSSAIVDISNHNAAFWKPNVYWFKCQQLEDSEVCVWHGNEEPPIYSLYLQKQPPQAVIKGSNLLQYKKGRDGTVHSRRLNIQPMHSFNRELIEEEVGE
ncbi:hypothetical protein JZ751_007848 [Albula glossodonta]|uniref:Uncharacterized protein n=1 Tax=Albula glossodonta TaxID=121402 RepID=A0A8T2NY83_9TELE|nr:hypothetical protein JZ751_007848 [Albula glossodonta]